MNATRRAFAVAIPLLLASCTGGGTAESAADETAKPIATVRTAPAQSGVTANELTLYGAAEAAPGAQHNLVAPADAVVGAISAPSGTAVQAGQVIVTLRPAPTTRLAFAKAAADVVAAQKALARAQRLKADGLGSAADVDTALAALRSAEVSGRYVGIGPRGISLRAPVAGTVQALSVKSGDQLAAGTMIATIVAPGKVRARFGVDPALAATLRQGQPLAVTTLSNSGRGTARIVGIDPQTDPTTRLAALYAEVPSSIVTGAGEPLKARLAATGGTSGITIPYAALLDEGGRSFVFVVRGGIARRIDVTPGNSSGDTIAILTGLQAGDRVVIEGGTALEDGMKVRDLGAKGAQ